LPHPQHKARDVEHRAVFVDTSGWIAFFSQNDRNHAQAEAMLAHAIADRKRLITSNLVLAEVHRLLLFRAGIAAAVATLDKIATSRSVKLVLASHSHHQRARAWLDKLDDQIITLTDAVSFAVMEAAGCRVAVAFDRDFWIAGFERFQPSGRAR
jgi:predicted nucleic acid-binding protein